MTRWLSFDSEDAALEHFMERYSDGLPVMLPTEERVTRVLAAVPFLPERVLGEVPPRGATLTLRDAAVNAVLAGCPATAFPIALTAIEAALDPAFNLNGIQSTTHTATPLIVVSGPGAVRAGMNAGFNAFGPGNRANAAIGRTLRLVMSNVGGGRPGETDMSVQGSPAKYTFCVPERLDAVDWPLLAQRQGAPKGATTVTLMAAEGTRVVSDHRNREPELLLLSIAETMRGLGSLNACIPGPMALAICPQHARILAGAGWSVGEVQRFLFEHARNELARLRTAGEFDERRTLGIAARYGDPQDEHLRLPVIDAPESLIVFVVGSDGGGFSTVIPSWVASRPVHRIVEGG